MKKSTPPKGYSVAKGPSGLFCVFNVGFHIPGSYATRAQAVVAAWKVYAESFRKPEGLS